MKKYTQLLAIIMALILALTFTSCGEKKDAEDAAQDQQTTEVEQAEEDLLESGDDEIDTSNTTTEYYDEELGDYEIKKVNQDKDAFYGTWIATSEVAEYYYGNVTITVKKGGKWSGIVTDEKLSGTWTKNDEGLSLTSELLDVTLSFTDAGKLIMQEDTGDGDIVTTVLIKK